MDKESLYTNKQHCFITEGVRLQATCNKRLVEGIVVATYKNVDGSEEYMIDLKDDKTGEVLFLPAENIVKVLLKDKKPVGGSRRRRRRGI